MNLWIILLWVLIVISLIKSLKDIPARLADIVKGLKGLIIIPISFPILILTALYAIDLSERYPILKWGWLNTNIAVAPLTEIKNAADATGGMTTILLIELIGFTIGIAIICLICNYVEEHDFRGSFAAVIIWAMLHLVMGIPIWAIIPIFSVGLIYKIVHDRWSLEAAYVAHFFTNMILISILFCEIIWGITII